MKKTLVKNVLSFVLSSGILLGGGISVLADERSPEASDVIEAEEDIVSEDAAAYGSGLSEIPINSTYFPDETFRNLLKQSKYDSDENGYLSEEEIDYIWKLDLYDMNI